MTLCGNYVVELTSGGIVEIAADDVRVSEAGALVFSRADSPARVRVCLMAPRSWLLVRAKTAVIVFTAPTPAPPAAETVPSIPFA